MLMFEWCQFIGALYEHCTNTKLHGKQQTINVPANLFFVITSFIGCYNSVKLISNQWNYSIYSSLKGQFSEVKLRWLIYCYSCFIFVNDTNTRKNHIFDKNHIFEEKFIFAYFKRFFILNMENSYYLAGLIDHLHIFHNARWLEAPIYKASKLVPGSLLPHWNSMRFLREGITLWHKLTGLSDIRNPVLAKFKHVTNIETCMLLCCDWITYVPALWNFQKADLNPTLPAKNTPLFLLSDMRRSLKISAWEMSLHAHVFSFTHKALVLWLFKCVHPKNQTKIFWFLHFYESKQMSLTQALKWLLEQSSALQLII